MGHEVGFAQVLIKAMSVEIHDRFLTIAQDLSPELAGAIARTGPVELTPRRDQPLPERLCRAVAGQQLSVKAAASIWNRVVASADGQSLIDHFATVDPQVLRDCGLSGAKTKAMGTIAAAALAGELEAERLRVWKRGRAPSTSFRFGVWASGRRICSTSFILVTWIFGQRGIPQPAKP
jgi:3-methyladenine DNA glycosylase/8-oxoguanine DNA glycosylase